MRHAGRFSSPSPLLKNKLARPGRVPPSVAVSPRICHLACVPCLYTPCAKELLRPTVGLLCLCQGLWIRTRKVLCCPRAGTRWRTFCTQRYSKVKRKKPSRCSQLSCHHLSTRSRLSPPLWPGCFFANYAHVPTLPPTFSVCSTLAMRSETSTSCRLVG